METLGVRDDLYVCARSGDLQRVRYLIEVQGQSVNQINEWQASPLFYACLAGQTHIVKYLLEQGARCEANTFDGERCHYAALTPEIRTLLKEFKAVIRANDAFSEFMLKIFNRADTFSDITFDVNGEEKIVAHRAILAARSAYLREQVTAGRWCKPEVRFKNMALRPVAWRGTLTAIARSLTHLAVLRALYCGRTELPRDLVETALMICRQCKLGTLADALLEAEVNCEGAWITVSLHPVVTTNMADEGTELQRNMALLARAAVPRVYQSAIPVRCPLITAIVATTTSVPAAASGGVDLLYSSADVVPFQCAAPQPEGEELDKWLHDLREMSDVIFVVEDEKFFCHKVFMLRCEYFKAMLSGGFRESSTGADVTEKRMIALQDISAPVFAIIIEYVYTDRVQRLLSIDSALLHDVLRVADLFLLTGLKTLCATYITQHVTPENVFELYRTAVLYELPRLEESTTLHMARNVDEVVQAPDFAALITESAATIKNRQGIDSLPLVDDIRSHLAQMYGARFQLFDGEEMDDYEASREATLHAKRARLDALLAELGIGALNRLGNIS